MFDKLIPIDESVAARVDALHLGFNHYGFDRYGVDRKELARMFSVFGWFYHHYFKVQVFGIENVPNEGRAMLVGNHSGGLPLDGAVVVGSLMFEKDTPRLAHAMVEKFVQSFPGAAQLFSRTGQFTGNPDQAVRLLNDDRVLLVFPEGAQGTAKLAKDSDTLVRFGTGFMRLALRTKSPIVPFGFVGGGEALPTIANLKRLGKMFGVPYIPVPRYLLMVPRPTSLQLLYGEPMHFEGTGNERDSVIANMVAEVQDRIASLVRRGRQLRNGELSEEDIQPARTSPGAP